MFFFYLFGVFFGFFLSEFWPHYFLVIIISYLCCKYKTPLSQLLVIFIIITIIQSWQESEAEESGFKEPLKCWHQALRHLHHSSDSLAARRSDATCQ